MFVACRRNLAELRSMPLVMERINKVKEMRLESSFGPTRELANVPYRFRETWNPDTYIVIPRVSSERRRYVPMGFLDKSIIPTDSVIIIPSATLYHFGVLESNVHMAWMRVVCGRLEMRYRYSKDVVYNNFPWPFSLPAGRAGRGQYCSDGPGHPRCPCQVSRLESCRPLRPGDDALRPFGGAPQERPCRDAGLRLLHEDDRVGVCRQALRDVRENDGRREVTRFLCSNVPMNGCQVLCHDIHFRDGRKGKFTAFFCEDMVINQKLFRYLQV